MNDDPTKMSGPIPTKIRPRLVPVNPVDPDQNPATEVHALSELDDLKLRSTWLNAKYMEQQYHTARQEFLGQFDRRPDVMETLAKIAAANAEFGTQLDLAHETFGTNAATHVYDMDAKKIVPRKLRANQVLPGLPE